MSSAALLSLLRGRRPEAREARTRSNPAQVRRILVVKVQDQLGDFLLCTPAFRALRTRYPSAEIGIVTRDYLAPLARHNRDFDRVWVMPRLRGLGVFELVRTIAGVGTFSPDLAVVFNSVSRSKTADSLATWSRARFIAGRSRIGPGAPPADSPAHSLVAALEASARAKPDPIYDLDLPIARDSDHQTERYLDLVRWTGARGEGSDLELHLSAAERAAGRAILEKAWAGTAGSATAVSPADGQMAAGPWVGLHAGAANPLKCWPVESFAELGARLAASTDRGGAGARLFVFDSPPEAGRAHFLWRALRGRGVAAALVPPGPIDRFAAACASLDLLACNDSGVVHVATALRVPTVSFHALGRPEEWAPRSERSVALYAERAIETISVSDAFQAARRLLPGTGPIVPS